MKKVLVLGVAALVLAAPAQAGTSRKPQKKTVKIYDNYYGPSKLTINQGSTVTWKWPADVGDTHDVKLTKKPKGAKFTFVNDEGKKVTKSTFQSQPYASGPAKFVVKGFNKPGKYHLICTFHETEMQMDIVVRK